MEEFKFKTNETGPKIPREAVERMTEQQAAEYRELMGLAVDLNQNVIDKLDGPMYRASQAEPEFDHLKGVQEDYFRDRETYRQAHQAFHASGKSAEDMATFRKAMGDLRSKYEGYLQK